MLLRIFEILLVIAIVVYGSKFLIELFATNKAKKRHSSLEKLAEKARKIKDDKATILNETQKNQETINDINNNLN